MTRKRRTQKLSTAKFLGWFLVLGLLVAPFQNCTWQDRGGSSTSDGSRKEGDVYDGKVAYLAALPGFTCENKSAPKSILVRDADGDWRLTVNEPGKCASINQQPVNQVVHVDGSPFAQLGGSDYYLDRVAPNPIAGLADYFTEFKVTAAADPNSNDQTPGDNVCANVLGLCSLRAAFDEMNSNPNRSALINIPAGTFTITAGLPINLLGVAYIRGAGRNQTIIDGGGSSPLFTAVNPNNTRSITVIDGIHGRNGFTNQSGYTSESGFALTAYNSLHIFNSLFTGGRAPNSSGIVVLDKAHIWIENSRFSANDSSVLRAHYPANFSVDRSSFLDNAGTAISAYAPDNVIVKSSTVARNEVGVSITSCFENCSIENSTITDNRSYGLMWGMSARVVDFRLRHSTVYNNGAVHNQNMLIGYGSGAAGQTFLIENSIVATPSGGDNCLIGTAAPQLQVVAVGLLASDLSCSSAAMVADPLLGLLADNGGPTLTRLPLLGSPAINAGDAGLCLPQDQRGLLRPSSCDIGSVEVQ